MVTQEKLKQELHYNPETGIFTRLKTRTSAKQGSIAGCIHNRGYITIRVFGKKQMAHRLARLYMYGYLPNQVDHIDNRAINLREVDTKENKKNNTRSANNTSGHVGVSWHKKDCCWTAYITVDYKRINLGSFANKDDAILARKEADIKYEFHENNGGEK